MWDSKYIDHGKIEVYKLGQKKCIIECGEVAVWYSSASFVNRGAGTKSEHERMRKKCHRAVEERHLQKCTHGWKKLYPRIPEKCGLL